MTARKALPKLKKHPMLKMADDVAKGFSKGFKGKKLKSTGASRIIGTAKRKTPVIIKSKFEIDEAKAKKRKK